MSNHQLLSSEQALDDYFTDLLEDEWVETEEEPESEPEPEPEVVNYPEVMPKVQTLSALGYSDSSYTDSSYTDSSFDVLPERDLPNLDDVQRLLSQLESSNPVAELELESVLEQNTLNIQVDTNPQVEEIQEWEIETDIVEVESDTEVELDTKVELTEAEVDPVAAEIIEAESDLQTQAGAVKFGDWKTPVRQEKFQVLYFDVNGVSFAVPLDELGGIHRKEELNHLIGRPAWYLGLQTNRDSKLDVVDTAKWVMADKLRDDSYKEAYQYIVMLGESMWGLACSHLLGTETLSTDNIRWREQAGKRPWLAGMVKEKMCALIHVEALVAMLNAGLDVKALNN